MFLPSCIYRHTDASHFWLNEGWTTYIERVLQQLLHGRSPARRGFSYLIGRKALQRSLEEFAEAAEKTQEEEKKKKEKEEAELKKKKEEEERKKKKEEEVAKRNAEEEERRKE